MAVKQLGSIAWVMDPYISREKAPLVTRTLNALRHIVHIETFSGDLSEEAVIKKLEEGSFQLILAPWYYYLTWSKVEGFFGFSRTSGPTFAGYFTDPVQLHELKDHPNYIRAILLDLNHLSTEEAYCLINCLTNEEHRSGLIPLFQKAQPPIYFESWHGGQGLGHRFDWILGLQEIANTEWIKRTNAIRLCLTALWSLIYDEGPGKGELTQALSAYSPKAYFQIAADKRLLTIRLCYQVQSLSPKDAVPAFWPDASKPSAAAQLLLRYADFVRVHCISESGFVELVVGLFPSAPAEKSPGALHTLWVEPLSEQLITEPLFEDLTHTSPRLTPLLNHVSGASDTIKLQGQAKPNLDAKERFLLNATRKIRNLTIALDEKETLIRELRAGGVGKTLPIAPPEAEALIEAFQERYFEAQYEIRQIKLQILEAEKKGISAQALKSLKRRMDTLIAREQGWIQKLAQILKSFQESGYTTLKRRHGPGK